MRGLSTTLTVLSVGIAVALMLILLGSREAGRRAFERGSGNMHMLVSGDSSPLTGILNNVYYANAPRSAFVLSRFDGFWRQQRLPVAWRVPSALGDSYRGLRVLATEPNFFTDFEPNPGEPWEISEGRFLDPEGADPFEVVLGSEAARLTGLGIGDRIFLTHGPGSGKLEAAPALTPDSIGDQTDQADHDDDYDPTAPVEPGGVGHVHDDFVYTVVGIARPTASMHDRVLFSTLTASWISHGTDARRAQMGPDAPVMTEEELVEQQKVVTGVLVRIATREGRDASPAIQMAFNRFRGNPQWTVAQPASEISRLLSIIGSVEGVLLAMAVVVFLSSGLGILLALYNSMEQRRRQVAVLRVLGASRGRVFRLVLIESAVIGLLGSLLGLVVAVGLDGAVTGVFRERYGLYLAIDVVGSGAALVCVGAVVLAIAAGMLPAAVAYRSSVARGLRPLG